jgi:peptidoglycan DL-endopeptidase CwlO
MPEPEDGGVELPEEEQITRDEAESNPLLRADPSKAVEGIVEEDPAEFQALELEAAEALLADEGAQADDDEAGGAAPISAHQRRALKLAVTQKGIRETPPGSNRNIYSAYFGFGPQFWCADFVAFCLDKTGNEDKKVPWGYPSAVENITSWGKRNGVIHSAPRMGDIFTRKDGKHTGFVLNAQGSRFMTIEGNTTGPGGCVYVASLPRDASGGEYFFVRHQF